MPEYLKKYLYYINSNDLIGKKCTYPQKIEIYNINIELLST